MTIAAERQFRYNGGLSETYSQDALRIGDKQQDDYITGLSLEGIFEVRTARTESSFSFAPSYYAYAEFSDLDHLDHRYRGDYQFSPGRRSKFSLAQGFSDVTRQNGFTDLAGAGSDAGQPIIGLTRVTAWTLEPAWSLAISADATYGVRATVRSESYEDDQFIDSDQYGLETSGDYRVGRRYTLGYFLRGDRFTYAEGDAAQQLPYERFFSAGIQWGLKEAEQFQVTASAGAFRGEGNGLEPATGPTAGLAGQWHWRRSDLVLGYGLGFSSGGGLSSADRSHRADVNYGFRWGNGYEARFAGAYILREPLNRADVNTLEGRSLSAGIDRRWHTGWGLTAGVSGLRQQEEVGTDLAYIEGMIGATFRSPTRARRAPAPEPPPGG
ncbi:MAG TPA: hypothetical protein VJV75_12955 [Candidatus Polarisedimenticolia bacterium]|nr:hypothetical protein [Candidatus Polarisedimenticolia bacterium]